MIRWSTEADAATLAALHRDSWRYAYAGILPGITLEAMVAARGPGWWRRFHGAGARALLIGVAEAPLGYSTLGRARGDRGARVGEIYELYLQPEAQGIGLGRALFTAARSRLADRGLNETHVWALAENEVGCRFYRALGGEEWQRGAQRIGPKSVPRIGFRWA